MRIAIVLLIILNFIWLEAYLNIYSEYKSKCSECDELIISSSKMRSVGRLDQSLIRLLEDRLDSQSNELSTLRSESRKQHSKIYRLKRDIKRKDRAIVRYKEQNAKFRHTCNEQSRRLEDLRDELLTEKNVAWWYKNWYKVMENERDAYLYCLRQIQEEVTNAKEE